MQGDRLQDFGRVGLCGECTCSATAAAGTSTRMKTRETMVETIMWTAVVPNFPSSLEAAHTRHVPKCVEIHVYFVL
jgi:hypothetical protein